MMLTVAILIRVIMTNCNLVVKDFEWFKRGGKLSKIFLHVCLLLFLSQRAAWLTHTEVQALFFGHMA